MADEYRVMRWSDEVGGYVPIEDPGEAREAARRCIYPVQGSSEPLRYSMSEAERKEFAETCSSDARIDTSELTPDLFAPMGDHPADPEPRSSEAVREPNNVDEGRCWNCGDRKARCACSTEARIAKPTHSVRWSEEAQVYVSSAPELDIMSQGRDREEALAALVDAIVLTHRHRPEPFSLSSAAKEWLRTRFPGETSEVKVNGQTDLEALTSLLVKVHNQTVRLAGKTVREPDPCPGQAVVDPSQGFNLSVSWDQFDAVVRERNRLRREAVEPSVLLSAALEVLDNRRVLDSDDEYAVPAFVIERLERALAGEKDPCTDYPLASDVAEAYRDGLIAAADFCDEEAAALTDPETSGEHRMMARRLRRVAKGVAPPRPARGAQCTDCARTEAEATVAIDEGPVRTVSRSGWPTRACKSCDGTMYQLWRCSTPACEDESYVTCSETPVVGTVAGHVKAAMAMLRANPGGFTCTTVKLEDGQHAELRLLPRPGAAGVRCCDPLSSASCGCREAGAKQALEVCAEACDEYAAYLRGLHGTHEGIMYAANCAAKIRAMPTGGTDRG